MKHLNLSGYFIKNPVAPLILVLFFKINMEVIHGQAPSELVDEGRRVLGEADYRAAHSLFSVALNQEPSNDTARLFLAATTIIKTIDKPLVQSTLDAFRFHSFGRNPLNWNSDFPQDEKGWPVMPLGWDVQSVVDLLCTELAESIDEALQIMEGLSNRDLIILLQQQETGAGVILVDWGDVALIRSGLHLIRSGLYSLSNFDFRLALSEIIVMREDPLLNVEDALKHYPSILSLLPETAHNEAKSSMTRAITEFQEASAFIKRRTTGVERLFTVTAEDLQVLEEWDQAAEELLASVQGAPVNPSLIEEEITVNMSQFYTDAFSPRDFVPEFKKNSILRNTFPDVTFGGTLGGVDQDFLNDTFGEFVIDSPITPPSVGSSYTDIDVITRVGRDFIILGWNNDPNARYEVYRTTNLKAANWEKVADLPQLSDSRRSYSLPIVSSFDKQFVYIKKLD
ncbi:MAG: hypothetical protein ACFHW5_18415 [Verrucomicrobiota bacterium]